MYRFCLPSGEAGRTAKALGALLRQIFRCSLTVLKYGSLRYSNLPCIALKYMSLKRMAYAKRFMRVVLGISIS